MRKNTGWLIFIIGLGASCLDEPDCFSLDNNVVGITYKVMGSGSTTSLRFDSIITSSADSTFHVDFSGTVFTLPLDPFENEMTFDFLGLEKSMTIGYAVTPQFVSEECGPRLAFSDLHVIGHNFDSVQVIQPIPGQNARARNIEIYRCPVTGNSLIGFYQLYSKARASEQITVPVSTITTDFTGTRVFFRNTERKEVTLPVNLMANSTTITFDLGTGPQDLILDYATTTEVRYRPCGEQTFVSELAARSEMFDSVSIARNEDGDLQNTLTDPAQMNVRIYRCPITNLVQIAFKRPAQDGTGTVNDNVGLTGIRTDYSAEVFYANETVSVVTLPLNPGSDNTTFYIDYPDRTETLTLSYTRSEEEIFPACRQNVFHGLQEAVDLENVTVLETDSITFPPVTNLEILNQ